jgi:hypothetical protein
MLGPAREITVRGRLDADVGTQFVIDVLQAARQRPDTPLDREAQSDGVSWRRVWILADDQHSYVRERLSESAQDVSAGGQVATAGGEFGPQELPHRGDLVRDRIKCLGPARLDELGQRTGYVDTASTSSAAA